jgi:multiple antibiotic resistance protein
VTEFLQLIVFMFAAINPAAAAAAPNPAGRTLELPVLGGGALFGLAVLASAAALSGPILDALGVEPETFRVGAGVVLLIGGGLSVWNGGAPHRGPWEGRGVALFPLGLPVLATPAAVAASISYGADKGELQTIAAIALVLAAAFALLYARAGRYHAVADGVARVTGALLIAVAAGLIVDGVRAI